jgi:hypothetical protein
LHAILAGNRVFARADVFATGGAPPGGACSFRLRRIREGAREPGVSIWQVLQGIAENLLEARVEGQDAAVVGNQGKRQRREIE